MVDETTTFLKKRPFAVAGRCAISDLIKAVKFSANLLTSKERLPIEK